MTHFPQLYTNRLILRKIQVEDIPALVQYANNKNVSKYILNIPYPYQEPDAVFRISYVHQGFKANSRYVFSIVLKEADAFIGEISLHLDGQKPIAQLAYWIGEPFWNQGIVTEAIARVLVFGFEVLQLELVFATCDAENVASVKVLEKNGLSKTGATGDILQYVIERKISLHLEGQKPVAQ
jgi:[ribosomal protein S5]-alanine N-acetyltransferase